MIVLRTPVSTQPLYLNVKFSVAYDLHVYAMNLSINKLNRGIKPALIQHN